VPNTVYIGRRKRGSHFGNPFEIGKDGTREEVVEKHLMWLLGVDFQDVEPERRQWVIDNLIKLEGRNLLCFCDPFLCHGENYIELLNQRRE